MAQRAIPPVDIGPLKLLQFLASFCQTSQRSTTSQLEYIYNLRLLNQIGAFDDPRRGRASIFYPCTKRNVKWPNLTRTGPNARSARLHVQSPETLSKLQHTRSPVLHEHCNPVDNHEGNHSSQDPVVLDDHDRYRMRNLEGRHESDDHR